MPNHKSTWKRMRQDKKRLVRNVAEKSRLRSAVSQVRQACEKGDTDKAQANMVRTFSLIEKAAKRRTIHPTKADRTKARLQKLFNKFSA